MNKNADQDSISHISFAALKLRGGAILQLHSLGHNPQSYKVEFAAALHGKCFFVSLPEEIHGKREMQIGDQYRVSGFNGISEFFFTTKVLQVQEKPFLHVHLAYPDSVEAHVVRKSARAKMSIPVCSFLEDGSELTGTLQDISISGVMVESLIPWGAIGDKMDIEFSTLFESRKVDLKIPVEIRHLIKHEKSGIYSIGLEFGNVVQSDKLVLYYLLYTLSDSV
jgi:c-di-GMP-binding flagellar brake protein YcgR